MFVRALYLSKSLLTGFDTGFDKLFIKPTFQDHYGARAQRALKSVSLFCFSLKKIFLLHLFYV